MSPETIWQPVVQHDVEPEPVRPSFNRVAQRAPRPAPTTDVSLAWLRKNPRSSSGKMARGMGIPINRATAHCRRMVNKGQATEIYVSENAMYHMPRYFYTAVPEVADGH